MPRLQVARTDAPSWPRRSTRLRGAPRSRSSPPGLTGGKGVKVMGPHLADHAAARAYALELLERGGPGEAVLVEERIDGAEFTIQAISDGRTVVFPNADLRLPLPLRRRRGAGYRRAWARCRCPQPTLPFMTPAHYDAGLLDHRSAVIERLGALGRHFSGVMNSGFFATAEGVKVIEFNARFGDPECMNIMSLLRRLLDRGDAAGSAPARSTEADVPLRDEASVVLYLVSPDYALRAGGPYEFALDREAIEADGVPRLLLLRRRRSARRGYRTVGTSRAVALASTAPTLERGARRGSHGWAERVPVLEWRRDVGDGAYLEGLSAARRGAASGRAEALVQGWPRDRRALHPPAVRLQHLPRRRRRGRARPSSSTRAAPSRR